MSLDLDQWPDEEPCDCECHGPDGDPPDAGEACCECWIENPYVAPVTRCPKHGMQVLTGHGVVGEHTGDPYGTDKLECGCEISGFGPDPEDVFFVREGRG